MDTNFDIERLKEELSSWKLELSDDYDDNIIYSTLDTVEAIIDDCYLPH